MSWSFSAVGRPAAVAKSARAAKDTGVCAEPEETLRKQALELIALSAENQKSDVVVRVVGSGSMWKEGDDIRQNNINLSVDPLFGFLE